MKKRSKNKKFGGQQRRSVARMYQIPGHLVPRVDAAASSGEDMAVFTSVLFGHLVAESSDGRKPMSPDVAQKLVLSVLGSITAVATAKAASRFIENLKGSVGGNSEVDSEFVLGSVGLGDTSIENAALVLGMGLRVYYNGVLKAVGPKRALEQTKKFAAESLANNIFALEEI